MRDVAWTPDEDAGGEPSVDEEPLPSTVQLYLEEIGRVPLLTAEEEVALFRQMEAGRFAAAILQELTQRHGREPDDRAVAGELVRRLERGLDLARAPGGPLASIPADPGLAGLWSPALVEAVDGRIPAGLAERIAPAVGLPPDEVERALRDLSVASRLLPRDVLHHLDTAARTLGVRPSAALGAVDLAGVGAAVRRAAREAQTARERLVQANLRLVVRIAKGYGSRRVPLLDLVQEGNAGLLRAAERFDYRRGFRFTTYAGWWIRQAIGRALIHQDRLVRLPVHVWEQMSRYQRARADLLQRYRRDPTFEEISRALGISLRRVRRLAAAAAQVSVSLDAPAAGTDDTSLAELLAAAQVPPPDEELERSLMVAEVRRGLAGLTPRERQVVALRYGLDGGEARTLAQVGRNLGLTRERVRQVESSALRKLRRAYAEPAPAAAAAPA